MGAIQPWHEAKDYAQPRLLFVAKHLFQAKGGVLLVEAFRIARQRRPDLALTIVGDPRSRAFVPDVAGIEFRDHLPWDELQRLYRESTLLVQPMLNDPWGQVYLEAMVSRTPVMGLARNGLPELVDGGRHGFLVDRADPESLAEAILSALSDPASAREHGRARPGHVLATHSWDRVGRTHPLLLKRKAASECPSSRQQKKSRPDHRYHRPGRRLSRRLPAAARLYRARHQAPLLVAQHRAASTISIATAMTPTCGCSCTTAT